MASRYIAQALQYSRAGRIRCMCHSNMACTCSSWQQAESTLNQLLTCMDGLATREPGRPVVVIAATNRPEAQLEPCLEGVPAAFQSL